MVVCSKGLDSGCYKDTDCLINKFNIKDKKELDTAENEIVYLMSTRLKDNPIDGKFDFEHYKAIHRNLFGSLYNWAGEIRKVDITANEICFIDAESIEDVAADCFFRLQQKKYFKNLPFAKFIDCLSDFFCETFLLHPFRDGNIRTQRIFLTELIKYCGYEIDFSKIDHDDLILAEVDAANGSAERIKKIFKENIKK